ncbi:L-type lectin-domain containing receptor kinase IV.4-like [Pistacia vera]|uniref:L-type lectin-domain containing receptor kinase IV.4-like n=1 Tax=Pistacia vera TaxID=55513 RepID=UPI001263686C|nr:L-type lectin-domain containing receptor kinase IV.4-like [Pistacia vera]
MQDPGPFFTQLDILENETDLDSNKTGFPRNIRKTITKLALVLFDAEIQTSQNSLAESSQMLDDAARLLRILASDKSKVRKFAPSYQIKNLIKKLEAKAATIIRDYNQIAPVIRCDYPSDWVASDTFVDTSEVFGRDADKENVIKSLLKRTDNLSVTAIVGTGGYLAPELIRTGKATTSTDVFVFGVFMLEVACGRRPIEQQGYGVVYLVECVINCWKRGAIINASDPRLEGIYAEEQMELVLKLGLFCSHSNPAARPNMRQLMQYLDGDATLPDISPNSSSMDVFINSNEASNSGMSFPTLFESSSV